MTTVGPDDPAEVTNSGTATDAVFNFTIPQGPTGTVATNGTIVIPFATLGVQNTATSGGVATTGQGVAFGAHTLNTSLPIRNGTFTYVSPDQYVDFIAPLDMTLEAIYAIHSNYSSFTVQAGFDYADPFIVIATSPMTDSTGTFTIQQATKTPSQTYYVSGTAYPANYVVYGSRTGINFPVPAGTRVLIVGAFDSPPNGSVSLFGIYHTGSLLFRAGIE